VVWVQLAQNRDEGRLLNTRRLAFRFHKENAFLPVNICFSRKTLCHEFKYYKVVFQIWQVITFLNAVICSGDFNFMTIITDISLKRTEFSQEGFSGTFSENPVEQ
jgi:hypothetical protein